MGSRGVGTGSVHGGSHGKNNGRSPVEQVMKRVRNQWGYGKTLALCVFAVVGTAGVTWKRKQGLRFFYKDGKICPPSGAHFGGVEKFIPDTAELVREAKATGTLCQGRPRTVVTMTTFYGRMQSTYKVIDSILEQTCAPDLIYVFVSLVPRIDREFRHNHTRSQPKNLTAITEEFKRAPSVKVHFVTEPELDFGPATKLLPALRIETDPKTHLITVDDDTLYHEDMVLALSLAATHSTRPVSIGFSCEEYAWEKDRGYFVVHARHRRPCAGVSTEGSCHGWLDGVSGVLFQRSYITDEIFNYTNHPHDCFLHDDVWFAGQVLSTIVRATPYLITPGFKSRMVRYLKSPETEDRPRSSSYFQTQKLRAMGIDPVLSCAASFDALQANLADPSPPPPKIEEPPPVDVDAAPIVDAEPPVETDRDEEEPDPLGRL